MSYQDRYTLPDGTVDAVALAYELRDALRECVASEAAVARRLHAPGAGGVRTVIEHWASGDVLPGETEWPRAWCRLYRALQALPVDTYAEPPPLPDGAIESPPAGRGYRLPTALPEAVLLAAMAPCPHGYGTAVCPTCDTPEPRG